MNMKTIIAILLAASAMAADITDLGVITHTSLIELKPCQRRKDFSMFKIEIVPRNARGWTNKVTFTTTNTFLNIDDLAAVPEGTAIMCVRSYCVDGAASPVSVFKIDVERDPPEPPTATVSQILTNRTEQKVEHVINAMQEKFSPPPPTPPGMRASPVPLRFSAPPLPGGTNSSYAQYQYRLEQAAMGRRRSQ